MVILEPLRELPMHCPTLGSTEDISGRLGAQTRPLESIAAQTLKTLKEGTRKCEVTTGSVLPPDLTTSPDTVDLHVTLLDTARTVDQKYIGWQNELPSRWSPATRAAQAREIIS